MADQHPDPRIVFVVHGRNLAARDGMFAFLHSIGLRPLEWSQAVKLTGGGTPYIGEILDHAFDAAQAVVVLVTPDEITYLRREYAASDDDPEHAPAAQARPNVLFEAGMAFGRQPKRTLLVELGSVRPFSDIAGRHVIRLDGGAESRKELAERLLSAGCSVDISGSAWLTAGDLTPPPAPGAGLPLGRRVPSGGGGQIRFDARYINSGRGSGRLQVTNLSPVAIHDLNLELPPEAGQSFHIIAQLPVSKLPPGKTASLPAARSMGPGADHFEITITGKTPDGDAVSEEAFVSLTG